ncbi:MAG: FAD-dependent oxidoreductase [Magnetococcales bacterium]|nr:FAD-dependent oxidoreductase [Magnetococcales bacterium]
MTTTTALDFLIIGAGIIGLTVALELRRRHPKAAIRVVDKEATPGCHASGRNSGVLHAGFYYPSDSLKARFTKDGNRMMTRYCQERGLSLNPCGKLVVATNDKDLAGIDLLQARARANCVILEQLTPGEARKMVPDLRDPRAVLYSPTTATVNPGEILANLVKDAWEQRIDVRFHRPYRGRQGNGIRLGNDRVEPGYVINASGLHADAIARDFGFSQTMAIVPFKGLYLKYAIKNPSVSMNIYPVPDLNNPFLGVHYTLTADGTLKIGPTAIPALWREHYQGLSGFKSGEMLDILRRQGAMLWHNPFHFRTLAFQELAKMRRGALLRLASRLATPPGPAAAWHWGPAGIRAQLLRTTDHSLVMDFHCEGDQRSFHILNAVSPGFTCAFPFAQFLCDQMAVLTK